MSPTSGNRFWGKAMRKDSQSISDDSVQTEMLRCIVQPGGDHLTGMNAAQQTAGARARTIYRRVLLQTHHFRTGSVKRFCVRKYVEIEWIGRSGRFRVTEPLYT